MSFLFSLLLMMTIIPMNIYSLISIRVVRVQRLIFNIDVNVPWCQPPPYLLALWCPKSYSALFSVDVGALKGRQLHTPGSNLWVYRRFNRIKMQVDNSRPKTFFNVAMKLQLTFARWPHRTGRWAMWNFAGNISSSVLARSPIPWTAIVNIIDSRFQDVKKKRLTIKNGSTRGLQINGKPSIIINIISGSQDFEGATNKRGTCSRLGATPGLL